MHATGVVGWLDPSLGSNNTGDQIIADAISLELREVLPNAEIVRLPTQRFLSHTQLTAARSCDFFVVGGTNLLNGNIPRYLQWRLDPRSYMTYRGRVSIMGVGWWQYQSVNGLSARIWNRLLAGGINSVRDSYTENQLRRIGLESINTSCPTVWRLPDEVNFPKQKPSSVVVTITDYHQNATRDSALISGLKDLYDTVFVWPQGVNDERYVRSLGVEVSFLGPKLGEFDAILRSGAVDYVGTRLHAGIRAMQFGVCSVIVAIDNRAREISRDIGLPIVSNELIEADWLRIRQRLPAQLKIPRENIQRWKAEFSAQVQSQSEANAS